MNRYINLLMLLVASWMGAQAQQSNEPKRFSLQEAVAHAKKNNYTLKNNHLDLLSSQKKVNEVLANGLPQVNAAANFTNNTTIATNYINFNGNSTKLQFGLPFVVTGSITASQLLFDGGFLMGVKASREFVNLSQLNINRNEIETEVNVTKAYYLALLLQTNVNLLDTNLKTLEKSKADLEKYYQNGLAEKTDFDRLTLQYSNLKLQKEKVADMQRVSYMVLRLQMGMPVGDSIILTDKLDELYKSTTIPLVESRTDYSKRIEYKMTKQQISLNSYNKKYYQMGYAPSLNAMISMQRNTFGATFGELGNQWFPGAFWGLNLSVPVFDGLRKSAQIQQADINIRKSENDLKLLENVIDQQVYQSKMAFERSSQQLVIQQQNLQLAQDIYDRVNLKYKNGLGSSLELTSAQNDLETARTNYLANIYDYFVAQLELRKAIGDIR